jgi:hypothetical protein
VIRKLGTNVKLLLIGGLVGLGTGVGLTVLYFSLATFFDVNAKVLNAKVFSEKTLNTIQEAAETGTEKARGATATDKRKAG